MSEDKIGRNKSERLRILCCQVRGGTAVDLQDNEKQIDGSGALHFYYDIDNNSNPLITYDKLSGFIDGRPSKAPFEDSDPVVLHSRALESFEPVDTKAKCVPKRCAKPKRRGIALTTLAVADQSGDPILSRHLEGGWNSRQLLSENDMLLSDDKKSGGSFACQAMSIHDRSIPCFFHNPWYLQFLLAMRRLKSMVRSFKKGP